MKGIYLSTPCYRHGELSNIDQINTLQEDADLYETLLALGLHTYASCTVAELQELAKNCVSTLLDQCQLSAADIDAVIYPSTCYFMGSTENNPDLPTDFIGEIIAALDMPQAIPYGVSFSRCVNSVNAIDMASGLIARGAAKNIVVLVADSMQKDFSRIVDPGISVVSDVASAILVSDCARSEVSFELKAIENHVDWELAKITAQSNFPDYLRKTVGGMEAVKDKVFAVMGNSQEHYCQLITNTVNHSVVRIFSQATGIEAGRIFSDNVDKLGHCDGSDILINLCDYVSVEKGNLQNTDKSILAIANGPFMWGGMSLEPVHTSPNA